MQPKSTRTRGRGSGRGRGRGRSEGKKSLCSRDISDLPIQSESQTIAGQSRYNDALVNDRKDYIDVSSIVESLEKMTRRPNYIQTNKTRKAFICYMTITMTLMVIV